MYIGTPGVGQGTLSVELVSVAMKSKATLHKRVTDMPALMLPPSVRGQLPFPALGL